jgi:hypothetical protein
VWSSVWCFALVSLFCKRARLSRLLRFSLSHFEPSTRLTTPTTNPRCRRTMPPSRSRRSRSPSSRRHSPSSISQSPPPGSRQPKATKRAKRAAGRHAREATRRKRWHQARDNAVRCICACGSCADALSRRLALPLCSGMVRFLRSQSLSPVAPYAVRSAPAHLACLLSVCPLSGDGTITTKELGTVMRSVPDTATSAATDQFRNSTFRNVCWARLLTLACSFHVLLFPARSGRTRLRLSCKI